MIEIDIDFLPSVFCKFPVVSLKDGLKVFPTPYS